MRYLTILMLLFAMTACDFAPRVENPFKHLTPDDSPQEEVVPDIEFKEPIYVNSIPGIPYWKGRRTGGTWIQVDAENASEYVKINVPQPPPDPRYKLKEFITLIAKVSVGIGFVMLLAGAVAFIYKAPVWDDLLIIGAIAFGGGVAVAVSYALVVIVAPIISFSLICYAGYVMYKKQKHGKVVDDLVDSFDLVKNAGAWDDQIKDKCAKLQNGAKKHVEASKRRRERNKKRQARVQATLAEPAG